MPRSSKAPPLPPEPDYNELMQNDVAKIKRLLGLDVNRLAIGQEIEGINVQGLNGPVDYTVTGVGVIEFVNVASDIVYGTQTGASDVTAPLQVTGLNVIPVSNTVLNLTWNANTELDLSLYNVYRGTSSGFSVTPGVTTPVGTPSTNSYSDTGRTTSTAYYYKVAAVDTSGNIGSLSTEANATTFPLPPAQITGLTVTPQGGSNTQLNLAWTAASPTNFNYYNVYRGPNGFTPSPSFKIAQPATNSYANSGLSSGTAYYYKVSAVDTYLQEGPTSSQVGATTTGPPPPIPPMLELHFDNDYQETSSNAFTGFWINAAGTNGFTTGQFGQSAQFNTPVTPASTMKDALYYNDVPELRMNSSVGFSFSCWVYPVDLTHAAGYRRMIIEKVDTAGANDKWNLSIDSAGILYFQVVKAGTTYKRQVTGFTLNSWQHIGAVFNGATNTVEVYRNGVAGVSSTAADVAGASNTFNMVIGCKYNTNSPQTEPASTYWEGRLDELRYYQVVLTSTQINNLKNTNAP